MKYRPTLCVAVLKVSFFRLISLGTCVVVLQVYYVLKPNRLDN